MKLANRPMAPRRFHLRVAAEEQHLAEIRDFLQEVGEKLLIPGRVLANTKLAVDEACTNIVKHGYRGVAGFIEVVVTGNGREFSIAIHDQGKSFDLRNVKSPDLKMYVETRKRGGLGVFLMNQLMDEVRYRAGDDGNVLTMSKRLGRSRRRRPGKDQPRRTLRFTYTVQAFGAITLIVALAFGAIHLRQIGGLEEEVLAQARASAASLAGSGLDVLLRKEPMSVEQTLLNQSIRTLLRFRPEYAAARVIDAAGRVWGSDRFEELFSTRTLPQGAQAVTPGARPGGRPGPPVAMVEPANGKTREVYYPILEPSARTQRALGWIQIVVRESAIAERISGARIELATIALFTLLLGYMLSAILITIFVQPIQALSDSVRAIGEGTMVADIGASGNDQIDDIARAFNEVTAKFRAAQGHLMEQERMQQEMQVAQEIQQMLLPRKVPELEGFELGYLYRAAKEVGGDYFDFLTVDERTVGVVVADVSGKGVPGSLVMTMIRTALRMEARGNRSASDVMARMNAFVTEDMKKGMFVTMFYVVLDSVNRVVTYASAGHNPMILYRGEEDSTYFLKPKGIPVGINVPDEELFRKTISVEKLSLREGDMLVIYTDGITEAMNPDRDQFGEARLLSAIKRYGHMTSQEFAEALNLEIQEFTGGAPQNDDITLVAIKEKVPVEARLEENRRELFRLIEEEGMPVAEACAKLQVASSTYYKYKRRVEVMGGEEGLKPTRPQAPLARASVEEEAAILEIVRAEPSLGAKRVWEILRATNRCRADLSERAIYEMFRRKGLNTREKRLEFSRNGTDKRMARLARALSEGPAPTPTEQGGGEA
ncbi:MAG: HAMP domain-containing protein [Candidatus Eisenbacteria bacterium]|uniref:HAMP domain-containing protein n=1 Tax=Eiseniibacteriota bacterium TaxID=2212470 RepID=A0A538TH66_UNCEI|nr:MAG: HAMP domain-containing protein [Candidatus Eisenbacteria bacterium]